MTRSEALALFNLDADVDEESIERRYRELYTDMQLRITNAPMEQDRFLLQNSLYKLQTSNHYPLR